MCSGFRRPQGFGVSLTVAKKAYRAPLVFQELQLSFPNHYIGRSNTPPDSAIDHSHKISSVQSIGSLFDTTIRK